jgi:AraC-like DNA-binding protein
MRKIQFSDLLNESVNVSKIEAVERVWKDGNVNRYPEGRGENIISYTLEGNKRIADINGERSFSLEAPVAVLIAKGTPYISQTILPENEQQGRTLCIRFAMTDENGEELCFDEPFLVWHDDSHGKLLALFRGVLSAYLSTEACPIRLKARMYELLYALCHYCEPQELSPTHRRLLPALKQIEKHPELNTPISELAALCFLSESYFRVQFREEMGCSPTDYRNRLRIEKAQELLDSSLWTTDLVAEKLGFCDTSHFYRVYKKIMGKTPRKSREINTREEGDPI